MVLFIPNYIDRPFATLFVIFMTLVCSLTVDINIQAPYLDSSSVPNLELSHVLDHRQSRNRPTTWALSQIVEIIITQHSKVVSKAFLEPTYRASESYSVYTSFFWNGNAYCTEDGAERDFPFLFGTSGFLPIRLLRV